MPLYPFRFDPIYKEKVWGGRSLERLGKSLPGGGDTLIGESWELADLKSTSGSGGGGGAAQSRITNGLFAGRKLSDLLERLSRPIMGRCSLREDGSFPLLIKFLDARRNLSVQVHPSPAYAADHPQAHLKSEAWYVLDAEPGAVLYKGVREGVGPEEFRRAIERDAVEDLLVRVDARVGDCHYLPSGTCHALGAGIVVAEVQTPSDTTFRVYDWGRRGRELHIEEAIACITFGPADTGRYEPGTLVDGAHATVETLVACEHFRIEKITMRPTGSRGAAIATDERPRIWMTLEGEGTITCRGGGSDETPFSQGQTLLLPADLDRPRLHAPRGAAWLEATLPEKAGPRIARPKP